MWEDEFRGGGIGDRFRLDIVGVLGFCYLKGRVEVFSVGFGGFLGLFFRRIRCGFFDLCFILLRFGYVYRKR